MPKISRSVTFAVIPNTTPLLDVVFLRRLTTEEGNGQAPFSKLEWQYCHAPWPVQDRDNLIDLLSKAGLKIRFFDPEHKQWMEQSGATGSTPCEGNRDGSWTVPDLREFEQGYLRV